MKTPPSSARTSRDAQSKTKAKSTASSRASKLGASATKAKSSSNASAPSASELIDERVRELAGWRGETLARMRALILDADREMTEEWKWMGTPVWSNDGIVCTGEAYKNVVKLTFAHGAKLPDPARLFNSSLEGNTRRAIDIHEGEKIDASAFKALVRSAVAHNRASKAAKSGANVRAKASAKPSTKTSTKAGAKTKPSAGEAEPKQTRKSGKVVLLSGGNPQIAKGDGDAPVQAYIAAMPGWKSDVGRRLDALIVRTVPNVRKAVKWNSPFYGIEGQGWFLAFHVFTRYIKVTFLRGSALQPLPPVPSKDKDARYLDIHEHDDLDEAQMTSWLKQAAALPGWIP